MPCLLIDLLSVAKVKVSGKKKTNTQCAFPSRESWDIGAGHRSSSILPLASWTKWERVWRCTIWIPKLWDLVKIWKWRGRQWKKENWLSTYWILVTTLGIIVSIEICIIISIYRWEAERITSPLWSGQERWFALASSRQWQAHSVSLLRVLVIKSQVGTTIVRSRNRNTGAN